MFKCWIASLAPVYCNMPCKSCYIRGYAPEVSKKVAINIFNWIITDIRNFPKQGKYVLKEIGLGVLKIFFPSDCKIMVH